MWKTKNNWRNRRTKSRKNQCARRKRNLQVLVNVGSGHHQTPSNKHRWKKNEYLRRTKKLLETKLYSSRNLIKVINTWAVPSSKILGTILKVEEGKTSTNRPENKKTNDDVEGLTFERQHRQAARVKKRRMKRTRQYWR